MKYLNYITLVVVLAFTNSLQAQKAKQLLDEVSAKMSAYQDITVQFDYTLENKEEGVEQNATGDAILKGDKYRVHFFETIQIFDGAKTYTIIPENEEVNIANYEVDEEGTLTPSKFYSFYKEGYTYSMGKSKTVGGKNIQEVILVPMDSNAEISSVIVGIDSASKQIKSIKQIGVNGTETTLKVKQIKTNQQVPDTQFKFNRKKYEDLDYIIND